MSECNEWYLYKFNESSTTEADRAYFGRNDGVPMYMPESEGMLTAGINVLGNPCQEINRTVPYFIELEDPADLEARAEFLGDVKEVLNLESDKKHSMNDYLFE